MQVSPNRTTEWALYASCTGKLLMGLDRQAGNVPGGWQRNIRAQC